MGEYEACLRKVYPALCGATLEARDHEEEAARIVQIACLESTGEPLS